MPTSLSERFIQERHYIKNVSRKTVVWYGAAFRQFAGCGLEEAVKRTPAMLLGDLKQRVSESDPLNCWLRVVNAYLKWLYDEKIASERVKITKTERAQAGHRAAPAGR
jgi:hypothetical protein